MTKSITLSSQVGTRTKYAYHKSQVVHYPQKTWDSEKLRYDAISYIHSTHLVTHLHIYAKWNTGPDGITPMSCYDIFFCVQGQYELEKNQEIESVKKFATYNTIKDLYPLAYKKLIDIKAECGVGSESMHLLLEENIVDEEINLLFQRDEIKIKVLR